MSNIGCPVCGGDHYKSQHGTGIQPKVANGIGTDDNKWTNYKPKEAKHYADNLSMEGKAGSSRRLSDIEEAKPADCLHLGWKLKWFKPCCDACGVPLSIEMLQEATALSDHPHAPGCPFESNGNCACWLSDHQDIKLNPTQDEIDIKLRGDSNVNGFGNSVLDSTQIAHGQNDDKPRKQQPQPNIHNSVHLGIDINENRLNVEETINELYFKGHLTVSKKDVKTLIHHFEQLISHQTDTAYKKGYEDGLHSR